MTSLTLSSDVYLDSLVYNAGASAFTIDNNSNFFTIAGAGLINNSGVTQQIFLSNDEIFFWNEASGGSQMVLTANGGSGGSGAIVFTQDSVAGTSTYIALGAAPGQMQGGIIDFFGGSPSADHGTFMLQGATTTGGGGFSQMENRSVADHGTFIMGGGQVNGAGGGSLQFEDHADAQNGTFICQGGAVSGASGGSLSFIGGYAKGSRARIELFGNSTFTIEGLPLRRVEIGSLEGSGGTVTLGSNNLTVGSNNHSTSFAGSIINGNIYSGGSLTKEGEGTLTLTGASTYSGDTTVTKGTLMIARNLNGPATGFGALQVMGGTLAGSGIVTGGITVGAGTAVASLSPGTVSTTGLLTTQGTVTFGALATFQADLDSNPPASDEVRANGVTVTAGAQIALDDLGTNILAHGTIFTLINNTAATPISGTFTNLADGTTITVGLNTYKASYEGGDGNDLTLTVQ